MEQRKTDEMRANAQAAFTALSEEIRWPMGVTAVPVSKASSRDFWPDDFYVAAFHAGIKKGGQLDCMIIRSDNYTPTAAVFTKNRFAAAPVELSRERLKSSKGSAHGLICNSGNANAATGDQGMEDARQMARLAAQVLRTPEIFVLVSSTGVIGEPLPITEMIEPIGRLYRGSFFASGFEAAEAIMTTDTFPKCCAMDVKLSTGTVRISGIAKGSGMICPNMATMLSFIVTDASIRPDVLQDMLARANASTFNRITVDGDTSTNDMVAVMANGSVGIAIEPDSEDAEAFEAALESLMRILAQSIVYDGEGATKFVEIRVKGTRSEAEAEKIAREIANSNLVKTAAAGEDPNWGRIAGAMGNAGVAFDPDRVIIDLDDIRIFGPYQASRFPDAEPEAAEVMQRRRYATNVSVGNGPGEAVVWTSDLSHGYVEINADYRT